MKKNILYLVIIFSIIGCSKSSDELQNSEPTQNPNTNSILINKIETTTNGVTTVDNYRYFGNKIQHINYYEANSQSYLYTGSNTNYVSSICFNDTDIEYIFYNYSNDRLTSFYYILRNLGKYEYPGKRIHTAITYNNDGTIDYEKTLLVPYHDGHQRNYVPSPLGTGKYTFQNGNLIKDEFLGIQYNEVTNYTYDTKNKPTKNILGFNKIFDNGTFSMNNIISINYTRNNTPTNGAINQIIKNTTYSYIYNSNDFPISSIKTLIDNNGTTVSSINYFY